MTCSFDLKEYALGESTREDARRIQTHMSDCTACRDEIARLQLTQASLLSVRDEEMPRRIAFVSDKVFEPHWYQRLWNSAPQLGFIAAAMLACAILAHGMLARPVAPIVTATTVDTRAIEREVSARLSEAVQTAVTRAVADSEARQHKQTAQLLQVAEQKHELDRRATLSAFYAQTHLLEKQMANMYVATNKLGIGE